jgi:sec-independent protein translocase protein TatB
VFGVGPTEMVVIAVVALLLFSPKELPKILRTVARFWGQLRATADEFKDTIMHADGVDELQEIVKGGKKQLRDAENAARRELMKARADMRRAQQKLMTTNKAKAELRKQEQVEGEGEGEQPTEGGAAPEPAGNDLAPAPEATVPASAYEAAERGRLFKEAQAKREAAAKETAAAREAAEKQPATKPAAVPPPPPVKPKSDANQGAA